MSGIVGQFPEASSQVERASRLVHSIQDDGQAAHVFCGSHGLIECVVQQSLAMSFSLIAPVYTELCQKHYRSSLMAGHSFGRENRTCDRAHEECVEANDPRLIFFDQDEGER